MGGKLPPVLATARNAVRAALRDAVGATGRPGKSAAAGDLYLVACSGGADSLALAATAAFLGRKGGLRAGAVVVDHGLQAGSAAVAARAVEQARALGLDPVLLERSAVGGNGSEDDARRARYAAFDSAADHAGAAGILLGHTLDDQAEQVLLGLARGSGTRSLSGMPRARGRYLRPFLGLRRADTEAICAHERLDYWSDPTNTERRAARNRVRLDVLPALETALGPGAAEALARTAELAREDADYLDHLCAAALREVLDAAPGVPDGVGLPVASLLALDPALRRRVLRSAVVLAGGEPPAFERVRALGLLLEGSDSAGPVQLAGPVAAFRARLRGNDGVASPTLVLVPGADPRRPRG